MKGISNEDQTEIKGNNTITSAQISTEGRQNQVQSRRAKAMFTKEEDKKLIKAVKKFGERDWKLISSFLDNRTGRQCRERWKKFLCPSLNHSPWTIEEDEILLKKYKEIGPKWSQICTFFQNRTDVNIKTRFTVLTRKMKKEQEFVNQAKIFPFQKFLPNLANSVILPPENYCLKKNKKLVKKLKNLVNQNNSNEIQNQNKCFMKKPDEFNSLNTNGCIDEKDFITPENNILDIIFSPFQQTIEDDLWNEYNIEFY